jgi:deazaflavin-dependent oxidoreductase (nitroreductase family)
VKPDPSLASEDYVYLTTTGRRTGLPREIEIWFALHNGALYMLAGARDQSDWVRNLMKTPAVTLRLRDVTYNAKARVIEAGTNEDALARRLLVDKYTSRHHNELESWGRDALPVAFEFSD